MAEAASQKNYKIRQQQMEYEKAKESLLYLPGIVEEEATAALEHVGPPYGLQAAMNFIHKQREQQKAQDDNDESNIQTKFAPFKGMKIRKCAGGTQYYGEVVDDEGEMMEVDDEGNKVRMWQVAYEEGGIDHLDWHELLQCRADRPVRTHPCRGRQLACLELFCGCGAVSQEFAERKWKVRSIDNAPTSRASDRVDISSFQLDDIGGMVPDFIWASPPCFTYSLMAGK